MMKRFVIIAEHETGKVLHQDGSRYQEGDQDYRLPFDSVDDAVDFSEGHREIHRDHECLIVDEIGKCLHLIR